MPRAVRPSSDGNGLRQDHRQELAAAGALQLLELRARRALGLGLADAAEPLLELTVADVAAHLRLGDEPVDVIADLLEGADVRIGGEAVERGLEAEARLRVREARQHPDPLLPEARDLVLEGDQVLLRTLG